MPTSCQSKGHARLVGHAGKALENLSKSRRNGNRSRGRSFDIAVALPHREQFPTSAHMLLDDFQFFDRAGAFVLIRFFEPAGEELDVTPNNSEWIAKIVNELGRGLAERGQSFFLRQLLKQPVIQFLDFTSRIFARPMSAGPFNVAINDLLHFMSIKWLGDVIVSAKS